MKRNVFSLSAIFAALGLAWITTATARADFAPVVITADSYNQDVVVEKTAPAPVIPGGYTTASMDGGTNNNGDTWNEVGYFVANPEVGLPVAGSVFTSTAAADHSYALAPSYTTNDAVMLDASATFTNASLTLKSPAAFGALSFLTSGGNGGCIFRYTVHHQDGTTETGTSPSADWFNGANPAWIANGRVNAQSFALDNYNSSNPRLYSKDVALTNNSSPITSIDLAYVSSAAGAHTCIMAVSGATATGAPFSPILVTGYNADIVVEAAAGHLQPLTGVTSATMDGGVANTGATWYERGYDPLAAATGLPAAGSTLTNTGASDHRYLLPANYTANNAVLLDVDNPTATITLATPAKYAGFSFLSATANGSVTIGYDVNFTDGTTESGTVIAKDWFGNTPVALTANGRVNIDNSLLDNVNNNNPRLYASDFALANTTTAVTSIVLTFVDGGANSRAVIFAVSGSSGAVAPTFDAPLQAVKGNIGDAITLTATASGTSPITYQWQKFTNGAFANISDAGNVSGSATASLAITGITEAEGGDYRLTATNAAGSATTATVTVTVLSTLSSVTAPGDSISVFTGTTPAAETVDHAIDQQTSKYLNFDADGGAPFNGPVGFVVTPSAGRSVVSVLRFYTAGDAPERDPADFKLEGSNDGGTSYSLIASGALALPDARNAGGLALDPLNQAIQQVSLTNTAAFTTYKLSFTNVKNNSTANSMQIGEVELLGVPDNSGSPFIQTQPLPLTARLGGSAQFTVAAGGSPAPSLQWRKGTNGVYVNLTDGANISGATTATLTVNNLGYGDAGDYVVAASNGAGSVSSAPARLTVISTLNDVTAPGDPITSFGDQSDTFWGASADAANAIDDTTTKYVNGGSGFSASAGFPPFVGPVGFVVTPSLGSTVVSGLRVYTADANNERDPVDYKIEGSNDGTSFQVISSGMLSPGSARNAVGLPLDALTQPNQEVLFSNSRAFTTYRVTFANPRTTAANSIQIAEIELLGVAGTSGPSLAISQTGTGQVTITSTQPGQLQSTTAFNGASTVWTNEGAINGSVTVSASGAAKFYRVLVQ
jgi:hypothetical protein